MAKESFEIVQHLQLIAVIADGVTRELNLITLDNDRQRLHIGDWKTDKNGRKRPAGPGLILTEDEAGRLNNGLWNYIFGQVLTKLPIDGSGVNVPLIIDRAAAARDGRQPQDIAQAVQRKGQNGGGKSKPGCATAQESIFTPADNGK